MTNHSQCHWLCEYTIIWVYGRYTMSIQYAYNEYTIRIQWVYNEYTMSIQWVYNNMKCNMITSSYLRDNDPDPEEMLITVFLWPACSRGRNVWIIAWTPTTFTSRVCRRLSTFLYCNKSRTYQNSYIAFAKRIRTARCLWSKSGPQVWDGSQSVNYTYICKQLLQQDLHKYHKTILQWHDACCMKLSYNVSSLL